MLSQKLLLSAAGAGADRVYVDDIFGIQLRTGSGTSASSTAAVVNGIDLSGEGGIVWVKERNANNSHTLFSSDIPEVSGKRPYLKTNENHAAATKSNIDINFNSNGYTIEGHDGQINQNNGNTYVDWAFRKHPGFFDVVTWTGNGTSGNYTRQIAHNLGSVPGFIIVKRRDGSEFWHCYHRYTGNNALLYLDASAAAYSPNTSWNTTSPTSTHFTVNGSGLNYNGHTYVAYIFAHQPNTSFVEEVYVQDYYANGSNITGPNGSGEYRFFYNSSTGVSYATVGPNSYQVSGQNKWDELSDAIFAALGQRYRVGNLQSSGTATFYSMEYFTGYTGSTYDDEEVYSVCGGYRGTGASGNEIVLGFEPQWVLIKQSNGSKDWMMFDNMRGIVDGENDSLLEANNSNTEFATKSLMALTPTGFKLTSSDGDVNGSDDSYIYIAIRRPNKPPSAGTDVLGINDLSTPQNVWTPGFAADALFVKRYGSTDDTRVATRLIGSTKFLATNSTSSESSDGTSYYHFDDPTGTIHQSYIQGGSNTINYAFKRAPGFFDVVTYTGTGSARTVNHNLGVAPELMIVKQRDGGSYWAVYSSALGATKYLQLNGNNAEGTSVAVWNNTSPTSSVFTVNYAGAVNGSGNEYIAYLFASLDGISKIGTYTGTGSARNLDFGFTAGARFFLYKRTDDSQNWVVFDTGRGITAGTDYGFPLNEVDAQFSGDYVDPYNAGISLTGSVANNSGATFIYLAIA